MSKEANAAALNKFAEAVNTGNYELFSDVVATDCVDHDPALGQAPGPDGYRTLHTEMRQAFPDMKVELAEVVADEEAIAFAYTFTGRKMGR
jgi:predicted ester cyclase